MGIAIAIIAIAIAIASAIADGRRVSIWTSCRKEGRGERPDIKI